MTFATSPGMYAVASLLLSLPAWAQEPLPRAVLDERLENSLYEITRSATILYNGIGNEEGCYRLYEGALRVALPLLDHRKELQKKAQEALERAARQSSPDRSFTLRDVIDQMRKELIAPKAPDPKPMPPPAEDKKKPDAK